MLPLVLKRRIFIAKFMPSRFSGVYLVFEAFQDNSEAGNGRANFYGRLGIFGSFCRKTPCPQNSSFQGGGFWAFLEGGGGSANLIFMGVGIFPREMS